MKHHLSRLALGAALLIALAGCAQAATPQPTAAPNPETPTPALPSEVQNLHWFGTSSYLYRGSQDIYFDPVSLEGELPVADLILVTHAHNDHYSAGELLKIIGPDTILIIGPNATAVYEQTRDELGIPATVLAEGESTEVSGIRVEAVPAFEPRFHARGSGGVGFIVSVDGIRLYHAGGTNTYPEMAQYQCDVAMLPLYSLDDLKAMVAIVPAEVILVGHTSYYTVQALEKLINEDLNGEKVIVALEPGPFRP